LTELQVHTRAIATARSTLLCVRATSTEILSSSESGGSRLLRERNTNMVGAWIDVLIGGLLELACTKTQVEKRRLQTKIELTVVASPLTGTNTSSNAMNSVPILSPVIDAAR
jgi:hypothetical protein